LDKLIKLINAFFVGFWLGIFKKDDIYWIDQYYFNISKMGKMYHHDAYNKRGLFQWEREIIEKHFSQNNRLLLIGAGGGREVLALSRMGFSVDGFEYNQRLVEVANQLLQNENLPERVLVAPKDRGPDSAKQYDGIIIGWGTYTHIQNRKQRIALLKQLRCQMKSNAPVLISFLVRPYDNRRLRLICKLGNTLRRIFKQELLEIGDDLIPDFVHFFTQEEVASELEEAGFGMDYYSTKDYGHAVGIAIE
jgi:2-polyprenyl-3-methyl-5-hydroxy-6-metoxy-1,4-benzoquinol methylase